MDLEARKQAAHSSSLASLVALCLSLSVWTAERRKLDRFSHVRLVASTWTPRRQGRFARLSQTISTGEHFKVRLNTACLWTARDSSQVICRDHFLKGEKKEDVQKVKAGHVVVSFCSQVLRVQLSGRTAQEAGTDYPQGCCN